MDLKVFKTHRPVDPSDPGFTIPGARLRWVSGRVRETSNTSTYWRPLRKSEISKELATHIQNCFPNAFSDGDTVRRGSGELILAYCSVEDAQKLRKELDHKAREQQSMTRIMPGDKNDRRHDYARIETYEEGASTIPRHFLKKSEE